MVTSGCTLFGVEGDFVVDQVGRDVFEHDARSAVLVDAVEHIDKLGDELFSLAQNCVLENFLHDFDELIQVYLFSGHHFELFGNLKEFLAIHIIYEVDLV